MFAFSQQITNGFGLVSAEGQFHFEIHTLCLFNTEPLTSQLVVSVLLSAAAGA